MPKERPGRGAGLPINPALEELPVYQPGRPIEETARDLGLDPDSILKAASNENPLGPSPKAIEAMRSAASRANFYPDGNAFYLKRRLAEKLGLQPENLIFGNGSNELIEFVGHALISPGAETVVAQYCFAIYPIVTLLFGGKPVVVPARDFGHDIPRMLEAIGPKTTAVFVANPNNPTGTLAPKEEIVRLIEEAPENVLVVIDEAYYEYLEEPIDLLPYVREGKRNLLLMRTFSKIYGLAGLRLGYGIACPELIGWLNKIRQPFNANAMAQAAALAALDDEEHVEKSRRVNREGLAFFHNALAERGIDFVRSVGNFVLVRVGDGRRVFEAMQKRGVIVRPMDGYGLPEWIRISIGLPEQNRRSLQVLEEALAEA